MATNPIAASESATPPDDDWLGYGAYADALWSRVGRALNKDQNGKPLGDDPLVIGIFGEWGAGKSHLLKLLNKKAEGELAAQIAARASDPGFNLTVPVWFQPWKYEHEEHLHVPIIIHVLNALKDALKQDPTVIQSLVGFGTQAVALTDRAAPVVAATAKAAKVAKSIFPVVQKIFKSVSVLGVSIDLPDDIEDWLEVIASGEKDKKEKEKKDDATAGSTTQKKKSGLDHAVRHVEDGTYFYRIHELLQELTRPGTYKDKSTLLANADLTATTRINFVIFIDDLDRCLPEKAVQTLELIKTILNAESFAFVLALDDEVIERGIGHRYKDYELQNKKPSMPITGFEYLEKIVHLPFKLPALTRTQARAFVEKLEEQIAGKDVAKHWFRPIDDQNPQAEFRRTDLLHSKVVATEGSGKTRSEPFSGTNPRDSASWGLEVFDLMALALAGFDAFVPRKLSRMGELWHASVEVAQLRHEGDERKELLAPSTAAQVDVRIAFTLMMIQLFHPDLYRVLRRHEETFKALYVGFDGTGENLSPNKSDIDLWHWAAYGEKVPKRPTTFDETLAVISVLSDDKRYDAQQKRLPLVDCIVAHRKVQRHVFDALKLLGALKQQMPSLPAGFVIAQYFSMLAQYDETLTPPRPAADASSSDQKTYDAAGEVSPGRFTPLDPQQLYLSLIAADEGTQEAIAKNALLEEGKHLTKEAVGQLAERVNKWLDEVAHTTPERRKRRVQLLRGLRHLAPFIAYGEAEPLWALSEKSVDLANEEDPKLRPLWGDVRAALGCDPRFEAGRLCLAVKNVEDKPTNFSTINDEMPGFAKIDARNKPFWLGDDGAGSGKAVMPPGLDKVFYIARTLTTVAQYKAFVDFENYAASFQGDGQKWLTGTYDSKITNKPVKEWLERRPAAQRTQPHDWQSQLKNPLRPVVNLSWFEAETYARWLETQLPVFGYQNWRVSLPTELQWECAARYGMPTKEQPSPYPWSGGPGPTSEVKDFAQHANLGQLVDAPTTVGIYPKGHSYERLADMAGNVWEWSQDAYIPELDPIKAMGGQKSTDLTTLRGGSWIYDPDSARCSGRGRDNPDDCSSDVGLRVVFSLAD